MTTVDLEHESGLRPLGEFPDHCDRCRSVAEHRARQAACTHDKVNELRLLNGDTFRTCIDCGASL